jgi:hypothetical protein
MYRVVFGDEYQSIGICHVSPAASIVTVKLLIMWVAMVKYRMHVCARARVCVPQDGHHFGCGQESNHRGWPSDHVGVGTDDHALTADYMDSTVWDTAANFIAIVRHTDGVCNAAKVWRYSDPGHSLGDYFDDTNPLASRTTVTAGGELFSVDTNPQANDPIFSPSLSGSDLIFNLYVLRSSHSVLENLYL